MSRFLIDLQEANNTTLHQESLASLPSLNFDRFVGSLGCPLPAPDQPEFECAAAQDHESDRAEVVDNGHSLDAVSRNDS